MVKIIIKEENKDSREFNVDKFPVSIGRSKDNTIRVNNPFLSREHCRIEQTARGFRALDLDSKNGISVNGQRVKTSDLQPGDVITIGNNTFTLVAEKEAYVAPKPPSAAKEPPAPSALTAAGIPDDVWNKQLAEEEITACTHCSTLYSIAYTIPGLGAFCPKCRTKKE